MIFRSSLAALLLLALVSPALAGPRDSCATVFAPRVGRLAEAKRDHRSVGAFDVSTLSENFQARAVAKTLLAFAEKHNLDSRVIEVGPPERRVKRLLVALDIEKPELVADYMKTFNLHDSLEAGGGDGTRTLALEFQKEIVGEYVFGALRTGDKPDTNKGVWRWGKESQENYTNWFVFGTIDPKTQFAGFGHLIGLSPAEAKNVEYYLNHPAERGPCKSDNCIAWTTGIELGKTSKDATMDERRPLFGELGVSRSIAHFEIARRLMHAANDRHVAMVAFVKGAEGLKIFRERDDILPPEPQQPMQDIIRGLSLSETAPSLMAMKAIPDGAKVFFPIAAGASPEGMAALIQKSASMAKGVDVHVLVNGISEATLQKGVATRDGKFRLHALFLGGNLRKLYREGKVAVVPGYLSDFARHVADPEKTEFHYDAMVVRVAPADAAGRYSLGPNNDMILTILRLRPDIKIIAEVNPNVPVTLGSNFLTEAQITSKFESHSALAGPAVLPLNNAEIAIGKNLATLIPDHSTLQLGIGNIFGGLPVGLKEQGRKDLKIWTEMFGDPMKEMIDAGSAVKAETGFAYGSTELYRWLDKNPRVRIVPTEIVNDPARVAAQDGFHAVNTALQVNLRGDVNATHGADGYRMSSPGGQVEFMSGAARSRGGKAIIAIRSTAKNGELSSIVLDTYASAVTTTAENVTHVVTEYGVAVLQGKSEQQRAESLIRIAHPRFRAELARAAVARGLLSPQAAQALTVVEVAAAPQLEASP